MKKYLPTLFTVLIFAVGIVVFLYPTVSNYLYEKNSSNAIENHKEAIESLSKEELADEKEAVRRYNQSLYDNAVVLTDPFDPDAFPITEGEYMKLLASDRIMAYLEIPCINVFLPICHGTSEGVLKTGVGHLENTSLPIGGETTHVALSAHCGLPSARLFTDLELMQEGNLFRIHVLDEVLTYQVYSIDIATPDDSSSLQIVKGDDLVTLITCTPYGKNTHRLLVHGRRISEQAASNTEEKVAERSFGWADYAMVAGMLLCVIFIILLILFVFRNKRTEFFSK